MKKLIAALSILVVASTAQAGLWDKIKDGFKSVGHNMTWEDVNNNMNLYVPVGSYQSPAGLDLFNTCDMGDGTFASIKDVSKCLSYKKVYDDGMDRPETFRIGESYTIACDELTTVSKTVSTTQTVCTDWDLVELQPGDMLYSDGNGIQWQSQCVAWGEAEFPASQDIWVWYDIDPFEYDNDGDTPHFKKTYTIPSCADAAGTPAPVPGKKK